ncbi:MAG: hypothetical protein A2Y10_03200 [Planctomycetes bacterium GWF2_41_51]|nr:MAG: hypothetical protein A2Y10_03200 [Planctomycetes bacterium GWF2_41_51]HBG28280.1 glycosyl transferase family 2 [Phycisphaerales bacterium]
MISCVIRTFNERELIGELLNVMSAQNAGANLEIIVVDSGSMDGTIEIVKKHKVKLIQIKKEEFNYSYALNLGIKNCTNEFISILSGHSVPFDESWLKKMISHFENEKVAGVYCKQIPRPSAEVYEQLRLEKTFGNESKIFDKGNLDANMQFSNAACCIRKSVWQKHAFIIMPAAEDKEWAQWAINHDYKIVYDASTEAYHSHKDSCRRTAERIIEFEKAQDLRNNRKRNKIFTIRQSIGWFMRDLKKIPNFKENGLKKLTLLKDCAARSFWYTYDFDRKK